jgi:hypothetical protein
LLNNCLCGLVVGVVGFGKGLVSENDQADGHSLIRHGYQPKFGCC